jgi:hypothetical protein
MKIIEIKECNLENIIFLDDCVLNFFVLYNFDMEAKQRAEASNRERVMSRFL